MSQLVKETYDWYICWWNIRCGHQRRDLSLHLNTTKVWMRDEVPQVHLLTGVIFNSTATTALKNEQTFICAILCSRETLITLKNLLNSNDYGHQY